MTTETDGPDDAAAEGPPTGGVVYEDCIVSFTDVLGFRHLLNTRRADEVKDVLDQMQMFTVSVEDDAPTRMSEVRFTSRPFAFTMSDAIVRVRPYNTQQRDGALVWELFDLVEAQIRMVNRRVLVRAA